MSRRFGLCAVVGVMSLVATPAYAHHIPGATYRGMTPAGGTVELDVSADGAAVTRFVAAGVPGACGGTVSKSFTGSLPIVDHAFSSDPADSIRFQGSFASRGQATGSLMEASCANAAVSWTAAAPVEELVFPPDRVAPPLVARARTPQRLGPGGSLRVHVRCRAEPCRVVAEGRVSVQGARAGPFRLKRASARLAKGAGATLEPKLFRRGLRAVRRALRDGRRVRVALTVSAVDLANNRTVRRLSIRPRLPR
jgi:hypothetical protein